MADFLELVPDLALDDQFQNLLTLFPDERTDMLVLVVDGQRCRTLCLVAGDDSVEQINNILRVVCGLNS